MKTKGTKILMHCSYILLTVLILSSMLFSGYSLLRSTTEKLSLMSKLILPAGNSYEDNGYDLNIKILKQEKWDDLNVLTLPQALFKTSEVCAYYEENNGYIAVAIANSRGTAFEAGKPMDADLITDELKICELLFKSAKGLCYVAGVAIYAAFGLGCFLILKHLIQMLIALFDKGTEEKAFRFSWGLGLFGVFGLFWGGLLFAQWAVCDAFNRLYKVCAVAERVQLALTGSIHPVLWLVGIILYLTVMMLLIRRSGLVTSMAGEKSFKMLVSPPRSQSSRNKNKRKNASARPRRFSFYQRLYSIYVLPSSSDFHASAPFSSVM